MYVSSKCLQNSGETFSMYVYLSENYTKLAKLNFMNCLSYFCIGKFQYLSRYQNRLLQRSISNTGYSRATNTRTHQTSILGESSRQNETSFIGTVTSEQPNRLGQLLSPIRDLAENNTSSDSSNRINISVLSCDPGQGLRRLDSNRSTQDFNLNPATSCALVENCRLQGFNTKPLTYSSAQIHSVSLVENWEPDIRIEPRDENLNEDISLSGSSGQTYSCLQPSETTGSAPDHYPPNESIRINPLTLDSCESQQCVMYSDFNKEGEFSSPVEV